MPLREFLEAHPDNENLLYLTDSEATLQVINKWIGGGSKLSLAKTVDADVLRVIIVKLQQRVKAKATTRLIKVNTHRGCPLNEEADIRAEMGRMKQEKEKTWSTSTNRTIYYGPMVGVLQNQGRRRYHQTNSMDPGGPQQNATESRGDPSSPCLREGSGKVAKGAHAEERERKYFGRGAGSELLEDKEIWGNETAQRGTIHDSRKRERSNEDGLFMSHQKGPITSTFTVDWFLREGQGRELLGEWMKKTAVRSQDQRRMLQANSHTFPTNSWIQRITKGRESSYSTHL